MRKGGLGPVSNKIFIPEFRASTSGEGIATGNGFVTDAEGLTGNEVEIGPGSWALYGIIDFGSSGGSANYTTVEAYFSSTEDATSNPTGFQTGNNRGFIRINTGDWENVSLIMPTIRITHNTSHIIYLNPAVTFTGTALNTRIRAHMYAERIY